MLNINNCEDNHCRNPYYEKKHWSSKINKIKAFANYGLIEYSEHALSQMQARGITKEYVEHTLRKYSTSIVQCHGKGTYNDNADELVVLCGKVKIDGSKQPIHIILAEHITSEGGVHYKVVTAYVPSPVYFHANGKLLKN
ncbi:MAG: DUF4258 domain-containing protein [Erysipelotrichales bacterium]|nr:DUF4258 domain-containing protein [Erysipelotrichales bacterium]